MVARYNAEPNAKGFVAFWGGVGGLVAGSAVIILLFSNKQTTEINYNEIIIDFFQNSPENIATIKNNREVIEAFKNLFGEKIGNQIIEKVKETKKLPIDNKFLKNGAYYDFMNNIVIKKLQNLKEIKSIDIEEIVMSELLREKCIRNKISDILNQDTNILIKYVDYKLFINRLNNYQEFDNYLKDNFKKMLESGQNIDSLIELAEVNKINFAYNISSSEINYIGEKYKIVEKERIEEVINEPKVNNTNELQLILEGLPEQDQYGRIGVMFSNSTNDLCEIKINYPYIFKKEDNNLELNKLLYEISNNGKDIEGNDIYDLHRKYCDFVKYLNENKKRFNIIDSNVDAKKVEEILTEVKELEDNRGEEVEGSEMWDNINIEVIEKRKDLKPFLLKGNSRYLGDLLYRCEMSEEEDVNDYNIKTNNGLMLPKIVYDEDRIKGSINIVALRNNKKEYEKCYKGELASSSVLNMKYCLGDLGDNVDSNIKFGCFGYSKVIDLEISYPWLEKGVFNLVDASTDIELKLQEFCKVPKKIIMGCGQNLHLNKIDTILENLREKNKEKVINTNTWYKEIDRIVNQKLSNVKKDEEVINGCRLLEYEYNDYCNKVAVKGVGRLLKQFFNSHIEKNENIRYVEKNILTNLVLSREIIDKIGGINNALYWLGEKGFTREKIEVTESIAKWSYIKKGGVNEEYCNIIKYIRLNTSDNNSIVSKEYKELSRKIIELREKEDLILKKLEEEKDLKIKEKVNSINDIAERNQEIKKIIEEHSNCKITNELREIVNDIEKQRLKKRKLEEELPKNEKTILDSKIKCEDTQVKDYKTDYNMLVDGGYGYQTYSSLVTSDKSQIKFIIDEGKRKEVIPCKEKAYKAEVDNSCIGYDEVHKISLEYPWLNKDIYKISPNILQEGGERLKEYQDSNCLIAKEVIIGSGLSLDIENSNVVEKEMYTVIGYVFDNYCDEKKLMVHEIMHDEL